MSIPAAYQKEIAEGRSLLAPWQANRLTMPYPSIPPCRYAITAVIYHFGIPELIDSQFPAIKCAILETWRHCGMMRTAVVSNAPSRTLEAFAEQHSPNVVIVKNTALVPGDVESMSLDCNTNLHKYFDTDFALIIQNDGFPLQQGIDRFFGKYDYIGAPFVRHNLVTNLTGLSRKHAVGNGGFSLRSKRICDQASYYWTKRYSQLFSKTSRFTKEDAFYCCVLPVLERTYRKEMRFAPIDEALAFSYDALYDREPERLPFGFHGPAAFKLFRKKGWIA